MMAIKALIVGVNGQDGYYLSANLKNLNYEVWGIGRGILVSPTNVVTEFTLNDSDDWIRIMEKISFDEVYYLAAYHHASEDRHRATGLDAWRESMATHVDGWVACLESLRQKNPHSHAFYAASSMVFGSPEKSPQDEGTAFRPETIYGITKVAGVGAACYYRQSHGLHVSAGFLYNHESPRRSERFVSQKIVRGLVDVKKGKRTGISLAQLETAVDWGYAPDYVEAMRKILLQKSPADYVIATGQPHTVADFAREACCLLGLDMQKVVWEDNDVITSKRPTLPMVGNPAKLHANTGWVPSISFSNMIQELVDAAL